MGRRYIGDDNETDYHREVYTGTDVVQHIHQRPAHIRRHSQHHLYADDLCIASQGNDFNNIEASLTSALSTMTTYYDTNKLRVNLSNTQECAFHLSNREAKRVMNVVWNGTRLSNTTTPVYLGIHLHRTLCYKTHIEKTKIMGNARNNIIRKLANSKWGCKASTLRPSCLALCYSVAEYACPVKKGKGSFLYSAVSSPLDRSKRFTLFALPDRPVHSDTISASPGSILASQ